MKKIVALTVMAILLAGNAMSQVKWNDIETAAASNNEKSGKLYFIDFYTSWCGWCKRMDRDTFSDTQVAKIMNKYYTPIKFDAEGQASFSWNGAQFSNPNSGPRSVHPFTYAILGNKVGFPTFAIFSSDKTLLTVVPGYMAPDDFTVVLWYFASGDYLKYSYDDYQKIFAKEIKPVMEKALDK